MLKLRSHARGEALDADGRIYCPMRATTIDHELCFGCSFLDGIDTEAETVTLLRCTPPLLFRRVPPA
jgi:hypothetical protein